MASIPPTNTNETAGTDPFVQARAAWTITLDGKDLIDPKKYKRSNPRVISLRLSEKTGEEADELEIVIHDTNPDELFDPPPQGSILNVSIGWTRGTDVSTGMVNKGSFTVDEVSWDGPPDKVTITARSADLKDSFRTRKTRTWHGETIGGIVDKLAADNSLTPRCHPDLADKPVVATEQHNKSDMQFLRDLGRHHDATATVKAGALIFAPRSAKTTATGKALPSVVLMRQRCARISWRRAAREKAQDGAEAQWHDQDAAQRKTVQHGGTNRRRLKRVYSNEADAKTAAESETGRLKRASATLEADLALGNALLAPGILVEAVGFRPHIDQESWRIASAEHSMDASGFKTRISMEVAG